ncbi:MAG TPA: hypothetical protein V6D47_06435 [Oscillatoriaceae cyanobacterium]
MRRGSALLSLAVLLAGCAHPPTAATVVARSVVAAAEAEAGTAIPAALYDEVRQSEALTGKPLAYATPAELDAYLTSIAQAEPVSAFDRDGWLASLGVNAPLACGKTDVPTLNAVRQVKGFKPGTQSDGHDIGVQVMAFDFAMAHPSAFLDAIAAGDPVAEAEAKLKHLWNKPFTPLEKATPTGETPEQRYGASARATYTVLFGHDVHAGIPDTPGGPSYGTYGIARGLGFTDDEARRIGNADEGIDWNQTPYGKTGPRAMGGQMDRHFNLDPRHEDTRLVWAKRHLEAAIALAKQTSYDQAEVELGCGLHSLQDLFAHGQLTPCLHAVIGEYPDAVGYDPIALVEATAATKGYLRAYLKALAVSTN